MPWITSRSTSGSGYRSRTTTTLIFTFTTTRISSGCFLRSACLKVYRDQPDGFAERYESLLSRTGMATAADLAMDFGIDIRDKAFWEGSVSVIRDDVNAFIALAG